MFWEEETAVPVNIVCFDVGKSPEYGWPSSPGENVRVEQNPSEDVINKVCPSFDLQFVSLKSFDD